MYFEDDYYSNAVPPSIEHQEKEWKRNNRDIFSQGKWEKIEGQELSGSDIGKRVKFLWFVPWDYDSIDVDGIVKTVRGTTESYYCPVEVVGGTKDDPKYHNYNVYGQTMYIQRR